MSMVNQNVKQTYACNGVVDSFAIPFAWYDIPQIIVHLIEVATGTRTLLVEGVDYTLDPSYDPIIIVNPDPMAPPPIPTVVTTTLVYSNLYQIEVSRATPLTQIISYINNSGFNAEDHEVGMNRIVMMVQELSDYVSMTFAELAELIDQLENSGAVLPAGGDEFSILEKASATPSDGRWTNAIVYQGYSENYNEIVNLQGLKATLDYVMKMGYAPPTINLLSSVANGLRERGDLITSMTLSGVVGKVLDDIAEVRFYDQSTSTLLDTQTSGPAIPNGGTNTYNWTGSFGNNKTFRVEVDDVSVQAKPSRTATLTYSFVYPYYVGAGAAGLGAGVSALTKRIINSTANRQELITVNGTQKMYFAYPSSYGALTSILDVNNFNTINDWTRTTVNITGLDGNSVSYYVYEFNNYALAGTYQYNFVR